MAETVQTSVPNARVDVLAIMRSKIPTATNTLSRDMLLPDFARYWLTSLTPDIKDSTRDAYQSAIDNHIDRVFFGTRLNELTSEDVQYFIMSLTEGVELEDPLSPKTIRNVHGVLHKCLQTAYTMKLIEENPAKHTTMPKLRKVEIIPLNTEQLSRFLTAISGHQLEVLLKLALFTGMRKGELMGLTWDCFNFEEGYIRLTRQLSYNKTKRRYTFETLKNGKPRTIYPPAAVMEMMKQHKTRVRIGKFVFPGTTGGEHLTLSQIRKPFERLVEKLDIPQFRFHDLRHTYAVISIKAGVDLKTISETMGHYSVAFTLDTYAFALDDMKTEGAQKMQKYMSEQQFSL